MRCLLNALFLNIRFDVRVVTATTKCNPYHFHDVQDQRIRACKDNTLLESDFDEVLGQDATQTQVFEAGQGETALIHSFHHSLLCLADSFPDCSACYV